jgi:hypothetical protein
LQYKIGYERKSTACNVQAVYQREGDVKEAIQSQGTTNESGIERAWLHQLIGNWTYEFSVESDQPEAGATATGTEHVWSIGDHWVAAENKGDGADGSKTHSLTVLSFAAERGRFTGSVAASMVAQMFLYDGMIAEGGSALHLETEGPALSDDRASDKYRDIIRVIDPNRRELIAQVLDADHGWRTFMRTRYRRADA